MNRIKDLRTALGMSQGQLGEVIGCHAATVSKYELEQRQLDPATICALCDLFNCTADYLLGRSSSPWPVISEEDARLLRAFDKAEDRDKEYIRHLLRLDVQEKRDVS